MMAVAILLATFAKRNFAGSVRLYGRTKFLYISQGVKLAQQEQSKEEI